ncbi:protein DEK isoform X2 [Agrilus planipennis]|uniref:Protein DEK n=1 Tax=Agrilus planipennis TaxID=224129 RepID=A0A1W4XLF1_AGRPL|nr:protein DEK isoform X2 [Agrilus planipennis]
MPGEEENIEGGTAEGKSNEFKKVSEVKSSIEQDTTVQSKENTGNRNTEIALNTLEDKNSEKASTVKEPSKNSETRKRKSDGDDTNESSEDTCHKIEDDKEKKSIPLLDQPLEVSGTRERKKVNRFNEEFNDSKELSKLEIPEGSGIPLGEIPRIDASISRFKNDDLKVLHRLLYKCQGKTTKTKANIKRFNGFDFEKDSEEYKKKLTWIQKFDLKQLKSICEMLDLEKKGTKDEVSERIIIFLMEPQDIGKVPGGGRPRRSAAVKASNRGSADERHSFRNKRGKGKRVNLKDDSSSGSDEEFQPSDESEEVLRTGKSGKRGSSEDVSDVSESSLEESDEEPKKRKKNKKIVSSTKKRAPLKRGRPANDKKKLLMKKQTKEEEDGDETDAKNNDVSSSEDEPLIKKKAKSLQPPTDEEIKTCVKEILDGANLEEITMKTVCKQVYANYPNFDLSHKKDFIKSTVKSLIST